MKILSTFIIFVVFIIIFSSKAIALNKDFPQLIAISLPNDIPLDELLSSQEWQKAPSIQLERASKDGQVKSAFATTVRAMWSPAYLYLLYQVPYTELTTFGSSEPSKEREKLYTKDVVEVFIGTSDFDQHPAYYHYHEFELAPNGDWLAVNVTVAKKTNKILTAINWNSQFVAKVTIDASNKIWYGLMRIPLSEIDNKSISKGTAWRINLFRFDKANNLSLAWNPTYSINFHKPARFGYLIFD